MGGEDGDVFDMIEVLVREEEMAGFEVAVLDESSHASGSVDDEAGVFGFDEEAVGLDAAAGEFLDGNLRHFFIEVFGF